MSKYTVKIQESDEIRAKRYLLKQYPNVSWSTRYVQDQGYVTVVTFDNREDAVEFQLKFLDNIDYYHVQT